MEIITYLNQYFLTTNELLSVSKVTEQELQNYQEKLLVPRPSYTLRLSLTSDSFFGVHSEKQEIDYYSKGYPSWLATIKVLETKESVFNAFRRRYIEAMHKAYDRVVIKTAIRNTEALDRHIESEWSHFLSGTYGLCTKSGLPEDIAAKEVAIKEIETLCIIDELSNEQLSKLTAVVNLLDEVSAQFAPHERSRSSRERLVNKVRRKYNLQ